MSSINKHFLQISYCIKKQFRIAFLPGTTHKKYKANRVFYFTGKTILFKFKIFIKMILKYKLQRKSTNTKNTERYWVYFGETKLKRK
jgi:hypothetical protein